MSRKIRDLRISPSAKGGSFGNKVGTPSTEGTIDFTGFFGEYEITIGANTYTLDLTKGTSDYSLIVGPASGDFDLDGDVDGRDFLTWQRGFGSVDATFAQGDATTTAKSTSWILRFGTWVIAAEYSRHR